ncbi:ThiF family adenylyltransferase [bacterium]|nr:ThiF family adenylyltransferase [bacterium]MBU1638059.1 ThiF family adenylyltransferase [bacterium]
MNEERYLRQQDVLDVKAVTSLGVTLIGLGSIGSITGLYLGKMGITGLQAYDADFVESHNWSNQMYSDDDIGSLKANAFIRLMESYGGHTPNAAATRYVDQPLTEVVISAVDSMESRKAIWKSVRDDSSVRLYVDARMGLNTLAVHTTRNYVKSDRVDYTTTLYSDQEALNEPCTARTVCYTPLMAASIVCSHVKKYVCGEQIPRRVILDLATHTLITE